MRDRERRGGVGGGEREETVEKGGVGDSLDVKR